MTIPNPFENPFEKILRSAEAQEADAVASPTLPVDLTGIATLTPTPEVSATPQAENEVVINLIPQNSGAVNQGDRLRIDVGLESNGSNISEYTLQITFTTTKLNVNLVNHTDDFFNLPESVVINEETGTIVIHGEALESPQTVNRKIADLTFDVVDSGLVEISVNEFSSEVINSSGEPLDISSNTVEFEVGQSIIIEDGITPPVSNLPKNNLEDIRTLSPLIAGVIFLAIGLVLKKAAKGESDIY